MALNLTMAPSTRPRQRAIFRFLPPLALAMIVLTAMPGAAFALQSLSIEHDGNISSDYLDYRIEPADDTFTLPDRAQLSRTDWQAVERTPFNLGYIDRPVWFRLSLHNATDRLQERYLEIAYPALDDVRIYVFERGELVNSSEFGDEFPFHNRPIDHPTYLKQLQVESGATLDILVRVKTSSSVQFPVALWRADTLLGDTAIDLLLNGLYYGTLLVMLIYNLISFINDRESKYLYYALYISSIGLFFACMNGYGFQYLWPDAPGLTKRLIVLSLGFTMLFLGLFTRSFLALPGNRPGLDKLAIFIGVVGAGFAVAGLFLSYSLVIKPLIMLVVFSAAIALLSGFIRWYDGLPAAMLFCCAWIILGAGAIAMAANKLAWIPRTQLTEYTAQLGSMLEFILLSLALIQQLNVERKAKYAAQQSALDFERLANQSRKQALLVQQEAARELELRVRKRTLELQIANEKLSTLSITDPLTGLKNRRFFNQRLVAEFARSKRDRTPISVIIIDIDHFKPVNDTHGHLLGDEVLKMVAQQIEIEARRESDIITRHGGEEFSAVLIKNSPAQALNMAERIRSRVAAAIYETESVSLRCTVSIGVATMTPDKHASPEELIQQADAALYLSKSEGRNRVSVYRQHAA